MLHTVYQQSSEYYTYDKSEVPKMVPIAPADKKYLTLGLQADAKKRYTNKSNPYTGAQAASIARRNARERNRVKQVNDGFNELRKRLPAAVIAALSGGSRRGSGKKLSKVDTLRMVVEYIRHMEQMLDESDAALGIQRDQTQLNEAYEVDEGVFGGRHSPYSESVPSPVGSECSSGVSSAYSSGYYPNYPVNDEQMSPMDEGELLDAITWWQEK